MDISTTYVSLYDDYSLSAQSICANALQSEHSCLFITKPIMVKTLKLHEHSYSLLPPSEKWLPNFIELRVLNMPVVKASFYHFSSKYHKE